MDVSGKGDTGTPVDCETAKTDEGGRPVKLSCLYTNADSLVNKLTELDARNGMSKRYHVIAVTDRRASGKRMVHR